MLLSTLSNRPFRLGVSNCHDNGVHDDDTMWCRFLIIELASSDVNG